MAAKIATREIGRTGVKVGEIGLGCMSMTTVSFGTPGSNPDVPVEPWFNLMKKSIEMGCNFFNTGEFYGDNEVVLRDFFTKYPELRDEVFISVKAGVKLSGHQMVIDGSPEFIKSNIDDNLKKLGVKKIDLYQMARVDKDTPIEITMGAIAECIKEGKVGHIGLSEASADSIRRAHKVHPIACVEVEYSLWSLDIENNGVLKACEELGISVIAYSPLGRGFLAGKYQKPEDAKNTFTPRIADPNNFNKNLPILRSMEEVAKKYNVTLAQLCIAWLLKQSPLVIPIPGTSKEERMIENVKAADIKLSDEDAKEIRRIVCSQGAVGARYPEAFESVLFGDSKPL